MARCSLLWLSDGEELGSRGRRRQLGQLVTSGEVEDEDRWWTMGKLAEVGTGSEEDSGRWSIVTHAKGGSGSMNGGSQRRWPATRALTGF
jgi:hypothetical protein